ncbi:hypothetical protein I4U23_021228 [Adineta vaga]|nr:hypothetical protein I4U23_021228 [Adineta vaga]
MTDYVSVRSNWSSTNSNLLERVCDVDIEEDNQSTDMDKQENDDLRKTTSSNENLTNITLQCNNQTDTREDPLIIIHVLQPDEYQIVSIQLLSSAKHIEFYEREYIGSCQGSRITELDSQSIYEASLEFHQVYEEITLKCLKLADITDLTIYCIQITMKKIQSISSRNFPFDLNRVRSMIDETHLSSNARQFMNDLQHIQEQRRTKENSSSQLNIGSLMSLMTGMKSSSVNTKQASTSSFSSIVNDIKSSLNENMNNDKSKENHLEILIDKRFDDLKQHIDQRFDRLEAILTKKS